jgi:hypothetical protein
MSEIRVTTLKDTSGGNSSSTADIFSGRAKAWVNFNGTNTVAIRANFNVNSITDNGTGDYTVNFSNAMSDANYAVFGILGDSGTGNSGVKIFTTGNNFSTAPVKMDTTGVRMGATNADIFTCCVSIFR